MTTKIRGIEFGPIWGGSGVQGFFGEGYWHHRFRKMLGMSFEGMTFVSKTTTLERRDPEDENEWYRHGNLPFNQETFQPKELFPKCIKIDLFRKISWNAVGLTGPGFLDLLNANRWQKIDKPFFFSFMSVKDLTEERMEELRRFCDILLRYKCEKRFLTRFALQINLSCPNQKNDPSALIEEASEAVKIASILGIPIILKFSIASAPIDQVMELEHDENCDGICISNTIPADWNGIAWQDVCGKKESPLKKFGGGGFSGPIMVSLVSKYIADLRNLGFTKHINGGGGIRTPDDVDVFFDTGADSVFIATAGMMPGCDVNGIIKRAYVRRG